MPAVLCGSKQLYKLHSWCNLSFRTWAQVYNLPVSSYSQGRASKSSFHLSLSSPLRKVNVHSSQLPAATWLWAMIPTSWHLASHTIGTAARLQRSGQVVRSCPLPGVGGLCHHSVCKNSISRLGQLSGSCVNWPRLFPKENPATFPAIPSAWHPLPLRCSMAGCFSSFNFQPKCGFVRSLLWPFLWKWLPLPLPHPRHYLIIILYFFIGTPHCLELFFCLLSLWLDISSIRAGPRLSWSLQYHQCLAYSRNSTVNLFHR